MTNLEIIPPSEVPAAQRADADRVVVVDYASVTTTLAKAREAYEITTDPAVRLLADAVLSIGATLTEIVGALDGGKVAVFNYPGEGAHLQD